MLDYIMTDQEIQARMEELYQEQQKCLKWQKRLLIITMVFFIFTLFLIPAHIAVSMVWAGHLANEATSLARKRYPYVPIGPGVGGRGLSWDLNIMTEASHFDDDITIKILKFRQSSVKYFVASILGCCFMWMFPVLLLKMIASLLNFVATIRS